MVKCSGGTFFCFALNTRRLSSDKGPICHPQTACKLSVDKSLSCHLLKGPAWLNQAAHFTPKGGCETVNRGWGGVVTGAGKSGGGREGVDSVDGFNKKLA